MASRCRFSILALALWALSACSIFPDGPERALRVETLAQARGWQRIALPGAVFTLIAFVPATPGTGAQLTVYLEGDGLAWLTPQQVSPDPTPLDPLALRLALAHPAGPVAYLARPCQYVDAFATGCAPSYWTNARFAPDVIRATQEAVNLLKRRFQARELVLVGFSGGGALAAMVAAEREDVVRLVTVAGNLDHAAWTAHHRVSPLDQSLNPPAFAKALARIPQWHFVGGRDHVVPGEVVASFRKALPLQAPVHVIVEPTFDHQCCWADQWPRLYEQTNALP